MEGAGVSRENVAPELGRWNVAHGSAPRFSPEIMRDLDMSANDLQAMYDRQLRMEGLDINPRKFDELFVAADEAMNFPGDPAVRFSPQQLEMMNQKLFQLQQQGVPSSELQRFARNQSFLLDPTTATPQSGPVRTVRQPSIGSDGRGGIRFLPISVPEQIEAAVVMQGSTMEEAIEASRETDRRQAEASQYARENVPGDFGITEELFGFSTRPEVQEILNP